MISPNLSTVQSTGFSTETVSGPVSVAGRYLLAHPADGVRL